MDKCPHVQVRNEQLRENAEAMQEIIRMVLAPKKLHPVWDRIELPESWGERKENEEIDNN